MYCPQQYYDRNCDEILKQVIELETVAKIETSNKTNDSDLARILGILRYKNCKDSEPRDSIYKFVNKKH